MYWEVRMRIHQQKHTIAEPCLFQVLFITNQIADALSDLSWTEVLARAEPGGSGFFPRTVPPLIYIKPWTTKPVLSRWGIFVAIAKNTL